MKRFQRERKDIQQIKWDCQLKGGYNCQQASLNNNKERERENQQSDRGTKYK